MSFNNVVPGWILQHVNNSNRLAAEMIWNAVHDAVGPDASLADCVMATKVAMAVLEAVSDIHDLAGEHRDRFNIWKDHLQKWDEVGTALAEAWEKNEAKEQ